MCFFEQYHKSLYNCNKPYQYVGGEFLSSNKDFDSADVRYAMCFPDKYEIGISNLGVRILYEQINRVPNFMCDRTYAPEKDFKPNFLYGVESKKPLKEFDALGFSMQYEMSYPTILKMLEMSGIAYRNDERGEKEPIIMAGGPCAFNPLPMSDFIDIFMIGDGEDAIVEVCEVLEKSKNLSRREKIETICREVEGCWSKSVGGTVRKRIAQLTETNGLTSYPIPFSSSIHDRAIVEIRRGCGRMCRFCQPGHVTLPIRERSGDEIVKIAENLVENTGYDEYSLLSLSSNDYSNIKEVIKELSKKFNAKKIGVSLPSQRIDSFDLELAKLTQEVRKSTMTLAPEAGSQRLRDKIKKNITEEQILEAILTLYENGWSRVKLYFISGLPTESLEDMDEMAALLEKIKQMSNLLKREKGLKHSLDLTCTLSIFVPKPFTPFQFYPQMNLDKITEHIHYLKNKTKHIKGLKINYHEKFVSQIEAVLTRGNDNLCQYIEALYKKGCYLDAWGENFDKNIWQNVATELGIDLKSLSEKCYDVNEKLPWDFIDVGLDKQWLINEYLDSSAKPTCEHHCVNCGVCKNFNVKKVLADKYVSSISKIEEIEIDKTNTYKYRIKLTKAGVLRYFSHLDWQNTFFKALSRTNLKIAYSQGFNPTMKVSMGVALPLFIESDCELVDIELYENISLETLKSELQKVLPKMSKIIEIKQLEKGALAIDHTVAWAEYQITLFGNDCNFDSFVYNCNKVLSSDEILLTKKNKKGLLKTLNIKSSIKSYRFEDEKMFIILKTGQSTDVPALRADDLMKLISENTIFNIKRTKFFDDDLNEL